MGNRIQKFHPMIKLKVNIFRVLILNFKVTKIYERKIPICN